MIVQIGNYSAVSFALCYHISLENVVVCNNTFGILFYRSTNCSMDATCNVHHNASDGVIIGGTGGDNITIRGILDSNGRFPWYYNNVVDHLDDGDNIGIGGEGGTMGTIIIEDATITNSGRVDGDSSGTLGSGIYVGTSFAMDITNMIVRRCPSPATMGIK